MLCVESTKLRYGPDLRPAEADFLRSDTFLRPLSSIPVCITESTVAASTHLYEVEEILSLYSDKSDKIPYRSSGLKGSKALARSKA